DRYHGALAHYGLGCAYAHTQPERAEEHLHSAIEIFERLGARFDLANAHSALAALDRKVSSQQGISAEMTQLLTLRLIEAAASRELLLRELAAVVFEETNARRVMMIDSGENNQPSVVVMHGYSEVEAAHVGKIAFRAHTNAETQSHLRSQGLCAIRLKPATALPATLIVGLPERPTLPGGMSIDSLLRVVE